MSNPVFICAKETRCKFVFAENKYDGTPSVEASKKLMNAAGVRYYQYQPTGKKLEINV